MTQKRDPWQCEWCGKYYPVPILASDCEDDHLQEAEPVRLPLKVVTDEVA